MVSIHGWDSESTKQQTHRTREIRSLIFPREDKYLMTKLMRQFEKIEIDREIPRDKAVEISIHYILCTIIVAR